MFTGATMRQSQTMTNPARKKVFRSFGVAITALLAALAAATGLMMAPAGAAGMPPSIAPLTPGPEAIPGSPPGGPGEGSLQEQPEAGSGTQPFLGISGSNATDGTGVLVLAVVPGSAAEQAGIRNGDVIVKFADTPINSMQQLIDAVRSKRVGDSVPVEFRRNGATQTASVVLASSDASGQQIRPFNPVPENPRPDLPDREEPLINPPQDRGQTVGGVIIGLVWLGVLALLAVLVVLLLLDVRTGRYPWKPATVRRRRGVVTPRGATPATEASLEAGPLDVLRMRYARGEIGREEYRVISADLSGTPREPGA